MDRVFVDSDSFIALNNSLDPLHKRAAKLSAMLQEKKFELATSTNVLLEATTLLSQRSSHAIAVGFLDFVRSGIIDVIHPTELLIFEAEELFRAQRSKNVSYSDCLSFAVMNDQKIRIAFSFDRDFKKNGFSLLEEHVRKN